MTLLLRLAAWRGARAGALAGLGLLGAAGVVRAQTQAVPQAPVQAASTTQADTSSADEEADTREVSWTLEIVAPEPLKALLERHLDLSRYLRTPDTARVPRNELLRLRQAAPAQARALLETEGYFNATVRTEADDSGRTGAVRLRVLVEPGVPTRVDSLRIEFEGSIQAKADQGDAESKTLISRVRAAWALHKGDVFRQDGWSAAKAAVLTTLRSEGYALATWSGTTARVKPPDNKAALFLVADSGPLFRFGEVRFEGLGHVDVDAVRALETFSPGMPMREQLMLDYQERLVKSSLFDTVSVQMDPDPTQADAMPLTVKLRERQMQQATLGLGVSDNTGPRITVEHLHQRAFGHPWQAKTKAQLGRTDKQASLDLTSHPLEGPYRNLVSGSVSQTTASGLELTTSRARVGRSKDDQRLERLYYLEWVHATLRDSSTGESLDDTSAVSANYQWVWRQLDNPILPTHGLSLSLDTSLGRSYSASQQTGWFGRLNGRVTHYGTFGDRWFTQTRLQLGQVVAGENVSVPFSLLFRTGGDDTVRGYGYQTLGPTSSDGTAEGGRVVMAGSVELARPFVDRMPSLLGAVFVDVGNAAMSWKELQPAWGYGVGVHWRSPVGPLRVDLAWGERVRKLRLHLSVGVTF